ncbi:hypothetical protein [Cupriavidus pauculus]|uniref:hypothetical protein n=1 Tax=Cupriavidus pauculus TaxID=82633 RepID=UPI0030F65C09
MGFSHFVSLGDSADVDVADAIDFLSRQILERFCSISRAAKRKEVDADRPTREIPVRSSRTGPPSAGVHDPDRLCARDVLRRGAS